MKQPKSSIGRRAVLGMMASAPLWAHAQTRFPTREIHMIVPWNPGGSVDLMTRQLAKLVEADGLRLIVEYAPGAGGGIGMAKVAAAAPDGYTLGSSSFAQLGLVTQGMTKTRNDQFSYINLTSYDQFLLLVPASSPVKDLEGFMKMMKERPGAVSIAGAGVGSAIQVFAASTAKVAGVDFVYAPYPGGAKAVMDLGGGQIDAAVLKPAEVKQHVLGGTVRPIAVYANKRLKSMPDVPTFAEKGYDIFPFGQMETASWIVGPAGIAPEVSAKLIKIFGKAIASREYQAFLDENDITVSELSGEPLKKYVYQQQEAYNKILPQVMKKAG